jgi:tetratricopeptide (TPR) repeat protein
VFEGLKELDRAMEINGGHSNLFYFRGLVELYLGKYDEALEDVIRAISKS